jgi:hypothetical protein
VRVPGINYFRRTMPKDHDIEEVPIPLDRESIERLARLGRACGQHPLDCAAALLRDLLIEDERVNIDALTSHSHH